MELCSDYFYSHIFQPGVLNMDPIIWLDGARSSPKYINKYIKTSKDGAMLKLFLQQYFLARGSQYGSYYLARWSQVTPPKYVCKDIKINKNHQIVLSGKSKIYILKSLTNYSATENRLIVLNGELYTLTTNQRDIVNPSK